MTSADDRNALGNLLVRVVDSVLITTIIFTIIQVNYLFSGDYLWNTKWLTLSLLSTLIFGLLSHFNGFYKNWRGQKVSSRFKKLYFAWLLNFVVLLIVGFGLKITAEFSRKVLLLWFFITPFLLLGWHCLVKYLQNSILLLGKNRKHVVIFGAGNLGKNLYNTIQSSPWLGYHCEGFFDDNPVKVPEHSKMLGDSQKLVELSKNATWDTIFIALPLREEKTIQKMIAKLSDCSAQIAIVPDFFGYELLHAELMDFNGLPILHLQSSPIKNKNKILKVTEDLILSILILTLMSPVLLITIIAIKVTSKGPVFFKQKRYGINGKMINVYKFRSMVDDACEREDRRDVTKSDKRVTKVGSFIRRTSIDELPQFINVLQGRMSIIGPRPHAKKFNEYYRGIAGGYMRRHIVLPGITGWAQVNGFRGETKTDKDIQKRTEYDLFYIQNWSVWFDLKIVLLTIVRVLRDPKAY